MTAHETLKQTTEVIQEISANLVHLDKMLKDIESLEATKAQVIVSHNKRKAKISVSSMKEAIEIERKSELRRLSELLKNAQEQLIE